MVCAEVTAFQCAPVGRPTRVHEGSWWTGGFNALWPRSSWAVMCVQCSAQLRGLRCAAACADVIQCSFACASMLMLAKHCQNSRETSCSVGDRMAVFLMLLRHRRCHAAVSPPGQAVTKIKAHLISLPSSTLFPCLSTVPFPPQSVDLCRAGLIPVTVLSHITHTPAICILRRGPSTAGVSAKSLLIHNTTCRLKFPLPPRCCMHFFFFPLGYSFLSFWLTRGDGTDRQLNPKIHIWIGYEIKNYSVNSPDFHLSFAQVQMDEGDALVSLYRTQQKANRELLNKMTSYWSFFFHFPCFRPGNVGV